MFRGAAHGFELGAGLAALEAWDPYPQSRHCMGGGCRASFPLTTQCPLMRPLSPALPALSREFGLHGPFSPLSPANKVDNLYPKLVWDEGTCVLGTAVNSLSSHHVVKTLGHYHLGPDPSWGPPGKRLCVPFPVEANQSLGASPASALFMAGQFPKLGGGALPHWVTRSP